MKKSRVAVFSVCTSTAVLALAAAASFSTPAAAAGGASGRVLTDAQIGAMDPLSQAARLVRCERLPGR